VTFTPETYEVDTERLTDEQKKAASHKKGQACVIAGAGTGKTRTLTERIFWLIEDQHLDPNRILVTTFTRKATAELYNKAYERVDEVAQKLRISTIDALIWDLAQQAMQLGLIESARLIEEAEKRLLLLRSAWEVFGQQNSYSRSSWTENAGKAGLVGLLEKCIRAETAKGKEKPTIVKSIRSDLEDMENRQYLDWFNFQVPTTRELKRTVNRYFEDLEKLGATDYDLISRELLRCLRQNKKLAKGFASQFDAILVDEFQDTSHTQAEILLFLSGKQHNIWVVGDPCQQIYEWRGAGPENLLWFIKKTRAKRYHLTENWRSRQPILDCAYHFLSRRVPILKKNGMLRPLKSMRDRDLLFPPKNAQAVFLGKLDQAFWFVKRLLGSRPNLKPSDIAILSRDFRQQTREEIERKANGLKLQFHSSRADHAADETVGDPPPNWKAGTALKNLYSHPEIQNLISNSLRKRDFSFLRTVRPVATAAEALDSTLPPSAFTFREAWPALKKTQDREVAITPAVVSNPNAIQVMTIHAAKGLEFPVVLLMKLGKGGPKSFPNPRDPEDNRLAYVGATRARDLLILVRTGSKLHELSKTIRAFGRADKDLIRIRRKRSEPPCPKIEAPKDLHTPPLIAATHLDLYEQCPLKFAAYHEGRFLPKWSAPQSMGSRMHKALEYYLRAEKSKDKEVTDLCFKKGIEDGDSPLRPLPQKNVHQIKQAYYGMVKEISETSKKILAVENRYRYLQGNSGQIEGVIDALIERKDGAVVLKEWKTSSQVPLEKERQYELQARAGALGMVAHTIDLVEIVPVFHPQNSISLPVSPAFFEKSKEMLEQVFRDLHDRNYEPRRGDHCKHCQLKPQCPAW